LEVVAPLLAVAGTCFIAISTLGQDPQNNFNRLMKSNLFHTYSATYVCDACFADGLRDTCPHKQRPSWMNDESFNMTKELFGDEKDRFARENLGHVVNNGPEVFQKYKPFINSLSRNYPINKSIQFLYVIIDPCAGSNKKEERGSDFAIVSMVAPHVIVGLDAFDAVEHQDYESRLIAHITKLREHPMLAHAKIVLDVEQGTGMEVSHIQALLLRMFSGVICMSEAGRKPGTLTSEASKHEMVLLTCSVLKLQELDIWEHAVSTDPKGFDNTLLEFKAQMNRYSRVVKVSKQLGGHNSVVYTGKNISKHHRDDLTMTVQRGIRSKEIFCKQLKYQKYF
jgi:hypothetical protein